MNNHILKEDTEVGTVVYTLKGYDPENSTVKYGILGTDVLTVNPESGEVTLVKPLDREVNDTLKLYVTIEDEVESMQDSNKVTGNGNNVVRADVTLIITDVNDNPPVFLDAPYDITVSENEKVGTTIFQNIKVSDADLVGDPLEVFCVVPDKLPNNCMKFSVISVESTEQHFRGVVVLQEPLDYAKKQFYHLTLFATDGKHNATAVTEIKVVDVQNTPPVFDSSFVGVVQENAEIGTLVLTVHARDGDIGNPREIVYELVTNPQDYFLLDGKTGELRTAKPLDKESLEDSTGVLTLKIRAHEVENGIVLNDSLSVTTKQATITIKDINDEPPRFNEREYFVEIPENFQSNTPLPRLNMSVTDPDVGNNSLFSLRLYDVSGVFAVEPTQASGSTSVSIRIANGTLDYENPNQRKFLILVVAEEISDVPERSSTATVTVAITDVNDNAPYFENVDPRTGSYSATVSETASPGELVTSILAKDKDSGSYGVKGIVYQLEGNGSEKFSVNSKTGVVVVAKCENPGKPQCLDYETKNIYDLTYKATDDEGKGQSNQVSLRISLKDDNDNPPVFERSQYQTVIDEGSNKFQPPFKITAHDKDETSQIEYYIVTGNVNNLFSLDPHSGEITVTDKKNGLNMTGVSNNVIELVVQATDGKYSSNATVSITVNDVNNNAPVFQESQYHATILENSMRNTEVQSVIAHDSDSGSNAEVKYQILKGGFGDFHINEDTGVVYVSQKLDYDRHSNYSIEIIAFDAGVPQLTGTTTLLVEVINSNDKQPYFSPESQRTEVSESAPIGTVVYKLHAIDPDVAREDDLRYEITEPIIAIDSNGKSVSHTKEYEEFFKVDHHTGKVFVAKSLKRDVASIIRLTVVVTDVSATTLQQGKGTLTITIIDVNDHYPTFDEPWTVENPRYQIDLIEGQNEDTVVATFTAEDADSTIAYYDIKPESPFFKIDNTSGVVRLKKEVDYEREKKLNFTIWAHDSGVPQFSSSAEVIVNVINVNDNDPVFSQTEYKASVPENSFIGTLITKVTATDADAESYGQVTYSLVGEHSNDFTLGLENGELRVANPAILDREDVKKITVEIVASDGAPPDTRRAVSVPVHITILDVNDNAPSFVHKNYKATIVENIDLNPPAKIVQVHAMDPDDGSYGTVSYSIVGGNLDDVFRIDSETGILYPKKSLHGQPRHFHLVVEGRDAGDLTDRATVDIDILNVNQNKPTFIMPASLNATVEVPENAGLADYLVMKVRANDADEGENGRITYHFKVNETDVQETDEFFIHPDTGDLRTKIILDREVKSKYELLLVAKDHGSPTWFETLRLLTVLLVDTNDNDPEFESERYDFSVSENLPVGVTIGQVVAVDKDEGKHARIYYSIISGNEENCFTIDRTTGKILANVSFDREFQDQYHLFIRATNDPDYFHTKEERKHRDILERDPSITNVRITILDDNDNPPKFEKAEYYAGIKSLAAINEFIAKILAEDPDLAENGTVQYYIAASNLYKSGSNKLSGSVIPSPFNISSDGKIVTATYMAEYNQDRFILEIIAKEKAYPMREARAKVHVWVFEPNQLIRVILSRPPEEVHRERDEIIAELSNATQSLVVVDDVRYHVDIAKHVHRDWTDMYLHVVDNKTQNIVDIVEVLKVIDAKYDFLKDYYTGFAIENVVPALEEVREDKFDSALAALIALVIVLFVGCITFVVVCCCLRNWILTPIPNDDLKKKDALIKKAILEELNTTENPLWIEQKLKLYEEQELTMQVFIDPDNNDTLRRNSGVDMPQGDNTYATIQHPNHHHHHVSNRVSDDIGDYETLTNNHRRPSSNCSSSRGPSQSHQSYEASLGFQGSTFQVPLPPTPPTVEQRNHSSPELIADV
ncbi:conserved hypothetical protein [Pediculus humanus corporis]|uniref:Cadherin domain-containing protein n=1 Tax=Pediculus humanus subsp. corporis TaxID=121224 RepID=E0W2T6_PEDHC|nr:uncharacterized protein Phum_PHUM596890 [Pediculus humanus corporis]EEB19942.1 conserved hypothetical protein [Pediculus humanus corporis]